MRLRSWKAWAITLLFTCAFLCGNSYAQISPPLTLVHTVAGANSAVPLEFDFAVTVQGSYQVTLTDLGALLPTPAPLASVTLGITSGSKLVGTPLTAAGTTTLNAAPGSYVLHVVGTPGSGAGSGPIGITITDASNNLIDSFSGTFALPPTPIPNNEGVLQGSFTVPTTGGYQVSLSDLQFPTSLSTLILAITVQGGALVTTLPAAGTNTVTLQSGVTYDIFAVAQATGTPIAGLYAVNVSPSGGGTAVYANAVAVGAVTALANTPLKAQSYTLQLSDLGLPAALAQLGTVVTLNGQPVAQLTAAGSAAIAGTVNTYQVFTLGLPGAAGAGSYALALQPASGAPALSVARAVTTPGGTFSAYSFDATVASAGPYMVESADFAYPAALTAISTAAVQGGVLLGTKMNAAGSFNITPAAGPISLLAFAEPGQSGSGLFGISLTANGATTPAFDITQGLGQLFSAQQVSIINAGTYGVTVGDVGFPAPFQSLAVIVTQGASQVGAIYQGGTFSFPANSGNYNLNFVAQPDPNGSYDAGTYSIAVATAPAAPTVTLTASPSSVASGGTVTLVWSSQNATSCTASGAWSGKQPTSGSLTSPSITESSTFTLTCTGAGGNKAQSVTVSVKASSGGGGGGGAIQPDLLLLLCALVLWRALPVMRASRTPPTVRRASNAN